MAGRTAGNGRGNGQLAISEAERRRLLAELDRFIAERDEEQPIPEAGEFKPSDLVDAVRKYYTHMGPISRYTVPGVLRDQLKEGELDPRFWKGLWQVLRERAQERVADARARWHADFQRDEFGYDEEVLERFRPMGQFLYRVWWRATTTGMEHVPAYGRALLVANHSGTLPWDGAMLNVAVWEEHLRPRPVRALMHNLLAELPVLSWLFMKTGQVLANPANAEKLLQRDQLACVFPEGDKGLGKPWSQRYKLARFGRGGFIRVALRARAPIIPVSIVGAEEIYPMLANIGWLGRLLGLPYFPITPTFPLLGPLGIVPLPSKWRIHFGEPLNFHEQYGPEKADDFVVVSQLMDKVRGTIQQTLDRMVAERRSIWF